MAVSLDSLVISLQLNEAQFRSDLRKTLTSTNRAIATLQKNFDTLDVSPNLDLKGVDKYVDRVGELQQKVRSYTKELKSIPKTVKTKTTQTITRKEKAHREKILKQDRTFIGGLYKSLFGQSMAVAKNQGRLTRKSIKDNSPTTIANQLKGVIGDNLLKAVGSVAKSELGFDDKIIEKSIKKIIPSGKMVGEDIKGFAQKLVDFSGVQTSVATFRDSLLTNLADATAGADSMSDATSKFKESAAGSFATFKEELDTSKGKLQDMGAVLKAIGLSSDQYMATLLQTQSGGGAARGLSKVLAPVLSGRKNRIQDERLPLILQRAEEILQAPEGKASTKTKSASFAIEKQGSALGAIQDNTKELIIVIGGYADNVMSGVDRALLINKQLNDKQLNLFGERVAVGMSNPDTYKGKLERSQAVAAALTRPQLRGFNRDAEEMASQAISALLKNPDLKIKLVGESGGGFVVEEAIQILNKLGFKDRVSGAGFGTPDFVGKAVKPSEMQNFTAYLGTNMAETLGREVSQMYSKLGLVESRSTGRNPKVAQDLKGISQHRIEGYFPTEEFRQFVLGQSGRKQQRAKPSEVKAMRDKAVQMVLEGVAGDVKAQITEFEETVRITGDARLPFEAFKGKVGDLDTDIAEGKADTLVEYLKAIERVKANISEASFQGDTAFFKELQVQIPQMQVGLMQIMESSGDIIKDAAEVVNAALSNLQAEVPTTQDTELLNVNFYSRKIDEVLAIMGDMTGDQLVATIDETQKVIEQQLERVGASSDPFAKELNTRLIKQLKALNKLKGGTLDQVEQVQNLVEEVSQKVATDEVKVDADQIIDQSSLAEDLKETVSNFLNKVDITDITPGTLEVGEDSVVDFLKQVRSLFKAKTAEIQGLIGSKDYKVALAANNELIDIIADAKVMLDTIKELLSPAGKQEFKGKISAAKGTLTKENKKAVDSNVKIKVGLQKQGEDIGKDFNAGLTEGLKQSDKVTDTVQDLAEDIPAVVKDELEIRSPSRVAKQLGIWFVEGLQIGLEGLADVVDFTEQTVSDLGQTFDPSFEADFSGVLGGIGEAHVALEDLQNNWSKGLSGDVTEEQELQIGDFMDTMKELGGQLSGMFQGILEYASPTALAIAGLTVVAQQVLSVIGEVTAAVIDLFTNMEAAEEAFFAIRQVSVQFERVGLDLAYASEQAARLGVEITSLGAVIGIVDSLRGSLGQAGAVEISESLSGSLANMGLDNESFEGALTALSQIASKGVVSMEELRQQLGERVPGAMRLAANAMGVTTSQLNRMVSAGEVMSDEFLPRFADELQRTTGEIEKVERNSILLANAMTQIRASIGQGSLQFKSLLISPFVGLLENIDLVKGAISALGVSLATFAIVGTAQIITMTIGFATLGKLAALAWTAIVPFVTAVAPFVALAAGVTSVGAAFVHLVRHQSDSVKAVKEYTKEVDKLVASLNKIRDEENKGGGFLRNIGNTISFGGLDRLDFTKDAEAADQLAQAIGTVADQALKTTMNLDTILPRIQELQGEISTLRIQRLDPTLTLEESQELMAQIASKTREVAELQKELSVPEQVKQDLKDLIESGTLTGMALQTAKTQLDLMEVATKKISPALEELAKRTQLIHFNIAIQDLEILQDELNDTFTEIDTANALGELDVTVNQAKLSAQLESLAQEEVILENAKIKAQEGILDVDLTGLKNNLGVDLFEASVSQLQQALLKLNETGDESGGRYIAALEAAVTLADKEDELAERRLEALELQRQISQDNIKAIVAADTQDARTRLGDTRRTEQINEIDAALATAANPLIEEISDFTTRLTNANDRVVANQNLSADLLSSVTSRYSTQLQQQLLAASGSIGKSFSEFAMALNTEAVDGLREQLSAQLEDNPILDDLLYNLSELANVNDDVITSQLEVAESYADLNRDIADLSEEVRDFEQELTDAIAATQIDTALTEFSTDLLELVPEQDSIFGRLAEFANKAAQAHAEGEKATLSYEQEVRNNAEKVQELSNQYSTLIAQQAELSQILGALAHNATLASNAMLTGGTQGTGKATFALPGQTLDTARVTSGFGKRSFTNSRGSNMHYGIDYAAQGGDDVVSMFDAKVTNIKKIIDEYQVTTEHMNKAGEKVTTIYMHLAGGLNTAVGQTLKAGQKMGEIAETSAAAKRARLSTGSHLDVKVKRDGVFKDPAKELPRQFGLVAGKVMGQEAAKPIMLAMPKINTLNPVDNALVDQANQTNLDALEANKRARLAELNNELMNLKEGVDAAAEANASFKTDYLEDLGKELASFGIGDYISPTIGEEFLAKQEEVLGSQIENSLRNMQIPTDNIRIDITDVEFDAQAIIDSFKENMPDASDEQLQEAIESSRQGFENAKSAVMDFQSELQNVTELASQIDAEDLARRKGEAKDELTGDFFGLNKEFQQSRVGGGSDRAMLELETAERLYNLEKERVALMDSIEQKRQDGLITQELANQLTEEGNQMYQAMDANIRNSATIMGQYAETARESLGGAIQSNLTSFFQNQATGWDMLRGIALDVLNSIASKSAELATSAIMDGLFGGGGTSGGGLLGGLVGSIFNFNEGGKVPNFNMGGMVGAYPMGGMIPYAKDGMEVMDLGLGVLDAMKREGSDAVPIVAHPGEWVLSDKTGDAQLYEQLKASGKWDNMKSINNFQYGGKVGGGKASAMSEERSSRNRFGAKEAVVINNTFNVKDYNSFNRSQDQMAARQKAQYDYVSKRG